MDRGRKEGEGSQACCCECCDCCLVRYCWDDSDNKFPPVRTTWLLLAFFFYIIDVGLDAYVAYEHYIAYQMGTDPNAGHYFNATLSFIVGPLIIINFLSWILYTWGWLSYRSQKLKDYCHECSEKLVYTEFSKFGDRVYTRNIQVVEDIKVISWPWYKLSHRHRRNQVNPVRNVGIPPREVSCGPCERPIANMGGANAPRGTRSVPMTALVVMETDGVDEVDTGSPPPTGHTEEVDGHLEFYPLDLLDTCEYLLISLIHLCMLGHVFRIFRLLYKRKQDRYSFDRYRDVSFLRLMEAFLESAPQLVLQLYIVVVKEEAQLLFQILTPISIGVSTISLALAVADYISAVKDLNYYDPPPGHDRKPRLTWTGYFLIIFWHLFMIVGRGISFVLFASVHGLYLFLVIGVHYAVMVYWMYWQQASVFVKSYKDYLDPRKHICGNYGIEFLVAAFNTFFHFKLKEGGGIETLVPFYVLTFVENTLMILLWYVGRDLDVHIWYDIPALVTVFGTFIVGVICLSIYYYFFQPSDTESLERNPHIDHPTLTCSLNRMYRVKRTRGNFFLRLFGCHKDPPRKPSVARVDLLGERRSS